MYERLILANILNNASRKNTNPTELTMYVIDKLIRQMRNSTLELDLNMSCNTLEKNKQKYYALNIGYVCMFDHNKYTQ